MRRKLLTVAALAVAGLLVWLLLRGTDWHELAASLRRASPWWLVVSQVPLWAGFYTRILRWGYIVRAAKPDVRFRSMFSATQIAFLFNFTIGMRSGEFVRPLVLGRLEQIPFTKGLALSALDRVADLVGLIAVLLVCAVAFHPASDLVLPPNTVGNPSEFTIPANVISSGMMGTGAAMLAIMVVLVLLYLKRDLAMSLTDRCVGMVSKPLAGRLCAMVGHFADGLHVFRSASDMAKAVFFSLITWGTFILGGLCFYEAFGLEYPWYTVFVMQALLALAVSAPGVPGMLGQFHIPIVVVLVLVANTSTADAKAVAIVSHLGNLAPIAIAGIYCLFRENMSLVALRRESEQAEEAMRQDSAAGPDS